MVDMSRGGLCLPLWSVFDAVAHAVPDREAIVWRDRRLTYRQLGDRSSRLAAAFHRLGFGCHTERSRLQPWESGHDHVGLYLRNGPEYLEASLAGYLARAATFNVNYRYGVEELAYLLRDARPAALIFHAEFAAQVEAVMPLLDRRPYLVQVDDDSNAEVLDGAADYRELVEQSTPLSADVTVPAADDLYVVYTGGTTGMPKGTLWTQGDIYLGALGGSEWRGGDLSVVVEHAPDERERVLLNAPLMHGAAHWIALRSLLRGGTVVVNRVVDRLDATEVWATLAAERCTRTLMVGESFVRPLLDELERNPYDTSSLDTVVLGGAATSPESKQRMHQLLPSVKVVDTVGASELGSALTEVNTSDGPTTRRAFRPGPSVQILDEHKARVLARGDEGVGWLAKSGSIPLGYLGDPDKTTATFPEIAGTRWSVPGDRAKYEPDGSVTLLGRDSATITSGGEKIFAEEVEAAVLQHPDVRDVVVVGMPDDRWGQAVVAVVSLVSPSTPPADDEILDAASSRIARYKLPKRIVRVPDVRRSPSGKADYRWALETAAVRTPSQAEQRASTTSARRHRSSR
jgi:fatty-acyl-CoA synthase